MAKKEYTFNYTAEELAELFSRIDGSPFVMYYDTTNGVYRFFPTEAKRDAWIAALESGDMTDTIAKYEFTGSITAPAPYTINVNSLKDNQYILYGSTSTTVEYSFSTVDGNGSSVNESVDAYYTFSSAAGSVSTSKIYSAGTLVSMNVDQYLQIGTNAITILLRGRSTGTTKTVVVTYYVVQLDISSTFDIARSIAKNTNFSATYTVVGQADKTVEFYIDGIIAATASISSLESESTRTQVFNNSDGKYTPGKHTLQIRASMMAGDSTFYSHILYYEFVITGIEQTQIMMSEVFANTHSILTGELPGLTGEQYVTSTINWAYYTSNPILQTANITWKLYGTNGYETTLATRTADVVEAETDKIPDPLNFMPTEVGDYQLKALRGDDIIESYTITVIANTNGLYETTEGLQLKLSGLGRSNDEPSSTKSDWSNRGYSATFSNVAWNGNSGWNDDALYLNNSATAVINYKPFSQEIAAHVNNGCVFEIDFETYNVDDTDAAVVSIGDSSTAYLKITGNSASLTSRNGTTISTKFKTDERLKLAFIVHPNSADHTSYPKMVFMQNNGVLAPAISYDSADNFNIGSTEDGTSYGYINLGNAEGKAGIKIYYIRCYNATVTMYEELNNYIIDSGEDLAEVVESNNIYNTGTHNISVDKLQERVTTVKITGPLSQLLQSSSKTSINGALEIICPSDPSINITGAAVEFSSAGQSTLGLPVPSMHVKLDKNGNVVYDRDGKALTKNRWAFRSGNCPEKKFRLQANYMDSSGCHNGAFLRLINEVFPKVQIGGEYVLRTPLQQYILSGKYSQAMVSKWGGALSDYEFPYNINLVPDSMPCVVVWRADESDSYHFLGQYVIMEEKNANYTNGMHSIYDCPGDPYCFSHDKDDYTRLWDNANVAQFEQLRNSSNLNLFLSDDDWNTDEREVAFEKEFPDDDDQQVIEQEATWQNFYDTFVHKLCSTNGDVEAFEKIRSTIFSPWHVEAYDCLMLRNACVDSVVRNMELITFDGTHWMPKWWDVDMQCGLQQSGANDVEPCSDRNTMQKGNYVFAGKDSSGNSSWFWDAHQSQDSYLQRRAQMDAALYTAGWTYKAMTELQDEYINAWSESLYNESGIVKYVNQYMAGNDYLLMLQGDRTPHRHWFVKTSYDFFDAKNVCGEYTSKIMYIRARGAKNGDKMYFKAAATTYFGWGITQTIQQSGVEANKGDEFTLTITTATELGGNDPIQIYAANKIEEADFHEIARYMWSTLEFDKTYDDITGTPLKRLVVGITKTDMSSGILNEQTNISFSGLNTMSRLEEFNIQGLHGVNAVDLTAMTNLQRFYAAGSGLTSFNPASGSNLTAVELPNTVTSISADGSSLTADEGNAITWWNISTQVSMPTCLRTLRFTSMGQDAGAQSFVHEWCQMLRDNESTISYSDYNITYTNVNWVNVSIDDLLTLAKLPSAQCTITGYVKCTTEYTTEQMNTLMAAFGENIFNVDNNLLFDCNSTHIIISATGDSTSVDTDGAINILQGTSAQFKAVGFPLLNASTDFKWYVLQSGDYVTGMEGAPYISFGNAHNMIHWKTGAMTTEECSNPTTDFTIYCERSDGGNGTATVRVKARTYPTEATISLASSQTPVDQLEGVYQIISIGNYIFDATHTPSGYDGTMDDIEGGKWEIVGIETSVASQMVIDYLNGHTSFDEFCMNVKALPEEDYGQITYTSKWKNGLTITASPLDFVIAGIVYGVLSSSAVNGNPTLFAALNASGLSHANDNSYNSMELKAASGTLDLNALITSAGLSPSALTTFQSGDYNVMKYLKNVTGYNLTATGLASVDVSQYDRINTVNLEETTSAITF